MWWILFCRFTGSTNTWCSACKLNSKNLFGNVHQGFRCSLGLQSFMIVPNFKSFNHEKLTKNTSLYTNVFLRKHWWESGHHTKPCLVATHRQMSQMIHCKNCLACQTVWSNRGEIMRFEIVAACRQNLTTCKNAEFQHWIKDSSMQCTILFLNSMQIPVTDQGCLSFFGVEGVRWICKKLQ